MKILLAEDERITRRSLQRELERWGHEVVAAEDGVQAWCEYELEPFELVVTDWDMPNMDGRELVERIRACDRSRYTYIIMLTGRAEKSDLVSGMEAGADDFVAKPFDREELRVRVRAGERIVHLERRLAAQNADLQRANDRMQSDLEAAAKIQSDLLPTDLPSVRGVRFAWNYTPCDELAGDLLNIVPIDARHVALFVADVSGHGVAASLMSVSLHRSLSLRNDGASLIVAPGGSSGARSITPPEDVVRQLNDIYPMEANGGRFVTLIYAVLDVDNGVLQYCCAGHPGPVLVRSGEEPRSLDAPSLPIGIVPDADYTRDELTLKDGDRVYLYSDGLSEAGDRSKELFGPERIEGETDRARGAALTDSVETLVDAAKVWEGREQFRDDVSVLAFEFEGTLESSSGA